MSQSWGGSQAQQQLLWVEKRAQLENNSPWAHSAPAVAERSLSPRSPCPDQARQDTGTPQGMVAATGSSHQSPGGHPVLRAGTGQWVQPPLGQGSAPVPELLLHQDIAGNYGTAVKYKLGKKPLVEARAVCE